MKLYVVVEGKVEKDVYREWIPFVNPELRYVERIEEVVDNCFYLITGGGYPGYFEVIDDAIADVNENRIFDRLIISIDSEDTPCEAKYAEILGHVTGKKIFAELKIIIQHFCIETWGLANRKIIRPHPQIEKLREYVRFFPVRVQDPELLPPYYKEGFNRSQFAEKYLRLALNDKFKNLTYTKRAPEVLLHPKYFAQVKNRFLETHHIAGFERFLTAFI
jgi:hypothetical protein